VQKVLCSVLSFQNIYAHRNWRIRRNTKKIWVKKEVEEGENEGVKDGTIRVKVGNKPTEKKI